MKIKLQNFKVPNFVLTEAKISKRQDGFQEAPKFALEEVDAETLGALCEIFRDDVFKKAGKQDPKKFTER